MAKKEKSRKNNIDWDVFTEYVKRLIEYQSLNTRVLLKAESWEEIIYTSLCSMGYVVEWDPADHVKGVDLKVKEKTDELLISAKGGKIKTRKEVFSISSYRLTRFDDLTSKLKFLKENAEELDIYLSLPRIEESKNIIYHIFKFDPKILVPPEFQDESNWTETPNSWEFKDPITKRALEAKIVKKMSNQLWYDIPLDYKGIDKLGRVKIKRKDLGTNLFEVLRSE